MLATGRSYPAIRVLDLPGAPSYDACMTGDHPSGAFISAVLIVKDEAHCLRACLEAVSVLADEVVVMDTGSRDGTVDIARAFTEQVEHFEWSDDFAEARNAALACAKGDWILQVDADEIVIEPSRARTLLEAFIAGHGEQVVGTVQIENLTGGEGESQVVIDHTNRFFRRGRFRYEGAVHEQIVPVSGRMEAGPTGVRLAHSGYAHDAASPWNKAQRNLGILQRELARRPDDEYLLYQIGKSYFALRKYPAAASYFRRALEGMDFRAGPLPSGHSGAVISEDVVLDAVTSLAYSLANMQHGKQALDLLEAHAALGHAATVRPDFQHVLGYVRLMQGNTTGARTAYLASLEPGPEREQVRGTGSFSSHYHLGLLAEAEKDLPGALGYYLMALQGKPDHGPTLARCPGLIVEHRIQLPPEFWAAADHAAFARAYIEAVCSALEQGERESLQLLVAAASGISPDLLAACTSVLEDF